MPQSAAFHTLLLSVIFKKERISSYLTLGLQGSHKIIPYALLEIIMKALELKG